MDGIIYIDNFLAQPTQLFEYLLQSTLWDERMAARKTASYGSAYNYSQISYPFNPMPEVLQLLCDQIKSIVGFKPNNCLINYYIDGKSSMGFHSDQIDILDTDTGIAIVSLGETRILRFRNIADKLWITDYHLPSGSLIYMT